MGEDMDSPRDFYKLSEISKRWNKTENDILHMAVAGDLVLSIWYDSFITSSVDPSKTTTRKTSGGSLNIHITDCRSYPSGLRVREYVNVRKSDLMLLLTFCDPAITIFPLSIFNSLDGREVMGGNVEVSISNLLVMVEEVARVEKKYPELLHLDLNKEQVFQQPENGVLIVSPENNQGHPVVDQGEKIPKWSGIANYLTKKSGQNVSISAAKQRLKDRRFNGSSVKQGGNAPGGVWAWSKALDSVIANPIGTKKKKEMTEKIGN